MATYAELKAKAEKYAADAEAARLKEVGAIIEDMKAKMLEYNITPKDLGIETASYTPRKTSSSKTKTTGKTSEVKYRKSDDETWSGRGRRPKWVSELIDAGKDIEAFAVKKTETA